MSSQVTIDPDPGCDRNEQGGRLLRTRLLRVVRRVKANVDARRLPAAIKEQLRIDRNGLPAMDPGSLPVIDAAIQWLYRAQDESASRDGGVARSFDLRTGWESSYPETTGYIISTLVNHAAATGSEESRIRAQRMLDWLVGIQMPCGAFQGGKIDSRPVVPVHFNTGQILLGLAAGETTFGSYRRPLCRAADWLVETQDRDGCWRGFQSPFAAAGDKTYDTHIAWALLEAAKIEPNRGYAEAALANVHWALTHQRANGWFDYCCLSDASQPLTHTIGYALRGVIEAYLHFRDPRLLKAARGTGDGVLTAIRPDGSLPGLLASDWSSPVDWVCLTGMAQIAYCWLTLYGETSDSRYRDAALAANSYLRRTVLVDGPPDIRGGVKGSFPIDGEYGKYQYLSWAAKFLVDSLVLEQNFRRKRPRPAVA